MIKDQVVVARYAEAFLSFARNNCGEAKGLADLSIAKNIIRDNPGFGQILSNPEIAYAEKCSIIDGVLRDGLSNEIRYFLKLLLEKKRFNIFLEVGEYLRLKYSHQGQVDVLLKTAFPLELDLIAKIEVALEKKLQKKLRFYIDLDGSLLGGVQVTVGNTIIDGSVRKRLEELKEKLTTVRMD